MVKFEKTGIVRTSGETINANICVDTGKDFGKSHTSYNINDYNLTESLVANQKYTISAKVNTSSEKKSVAFYLSGGSMALCNWLPITDDGYYKATFTATSNHASSTNGLGHGYIRVYVSNNQGTQGSTSLSGTASVDWLKLESGEVATPWILNEADDGYSSIHGLAEIGSGLSVYENHIQTTEFIEW